MAQKPQVPPRPGARPTVTAPPRQQARPAAAPVQPRPAPPQPRPAAPQPRPVAPPRQEVANRRGQEVSADVSVPEHMRAMAGMGTEKIGQGDIETPRIKLLQSNSPELQMFEEAKPGRFWHSIGQFDLGAEITIVPVYTDQQAILWRPRDAGGGILARSIDLTHWSPANATYEVQLDKKDGGARVVWNTSTSVAASRLLEWGSMDPNDPQSPPAGTRMYNVVCALPHMGDDFPPAVMTLQRSGIKVARKFMGNLKLVRAPSFGCRFIVRSVVDTNPNNQTFYNYQFMAAGFVEDRDEFEIYRNYYEAFRQMGLTIQDIEGLQPEEVDAGSSGANPSY